MKTLAIQALGAISLSLFAVAPAAAEELQTTVRYDDLDIASAQGSETLQARIQAGIKSVCERPDIRDLKAVAAWNACRDTAMSSALEQLALKGAVVG